MMRNHSLALFLLIAAGAGFGQEQTPVPDPGVAPASAPTETVAKPAAPVSLSQEEIRAMLRQVAEKDKENDRRQRDYTYVERVVEHKLNGKGEIGSTETRTFDVLQIYEEQVRRLTSKNDKPLSAKEAEKEEEKTRQSRQVISPGDDGLRVLPVYRQANA